jgi:hypothetical protein
MLLEKHITSLKIVSTIIIMDTSFLQILPRLKPPYGPRLRSNTTSYWLRTYLPRDVRKYVNDPRP